VPGFPEGPPLFVASRLQPGSASLTFSLRGLGPYEADVRFGSSDFGAVTRGEGDLEHIHLLDLIREHASPVRQRPFNGSSNFDEDRPHSS
jgi:hypothetical protein